MELEELPQLPSAALNNPQRPDSITSFDRRDSQTGRRPESLSGGLPSPTTAVEALQRWNHPRTNTYRSFAAFWGFIVMGMNDAAYGVGLPINLLYRCRTDYGTGTHSLRRNP